MGSLTLHKNPTRPAVFLAGGIGIAPFYSMLGQATKEQLGHKLFLFYANRRKEDAGYLPVDVDPADIRTEEFVGY